MTINEQTNQKLVVNTFERINLKNGNSQILKPLSTSRCGHIQWVDPVSKKIYVACGTNKLDAEVRLNSIEIYDTVGNIWTSSSGKKIPHFKI